MQVNKKAFKLKTNIRVKTILAEESFTHWQSCANWPEWTQTGTNRVINKSLDTPHHILIGASFHKYHQLLKQVKIIQFYTASNTNKKLLQGIALPTLLNVYLAMGR